MSGVFEERTRLKDLILRILYEEESASISGIQKRLVDHGENLHRLIVTGYLRAMHDLGLLEERDLPPSKVYSLKPGPDRRDLHDAAGSAVAARGLARSQEARLLVAVLHRIFHRPVFKAEVVRAHLDPVNLVDWEVETKDRQAARQVVVKAGIELPHNDPAYVPPARLDPEIAAARDEVLAEVAAKAFNAASLVQRGKQTTLREM